MIEELTQEQQDRIPIIKKKWRDISLSTGPCNRSRVEDYIKEIYAAFQYEAPKEIHWTRSPITGIILGCCLMERDNNPNSNKEILNRIISHCENNQYKSFKELIPEKEEREIVKGMIESQFNQCGYGTHDASWLSFYDFFDCDLFVDPIQDLNLPEIIKPLRPLIEMSKQIGWWWPFDDAVVISERPKSVTINDQDQLHHTHKPAISWEDGFSIYAFNGVQVPQYIIETPELIEVSKIIEEDNQEIKRVMLEIYGYPRFLEELGAKIIHEDKCGILVSTDKLGQYLDGEDPVAKFVIVKDASTYRKYALRVDPKTVTAKEGVAATFGFLPEDYNPGQET